MAKDETTPETTPEATPEAPAEEAQAQTAAADPAAAPEETSADTPAETPEPEEIPEQVYTLAELKENAMAIFNVQPEVIAGALYGNSKQEFTVSELQKLINKFLRKKVE